MFLIKFILVLFLFSFPFANEKIIKIIATANVMGEIDPCGWPKNPLGGLARKATIVNQIKSGKKLTITDPNMTRFLMNLNDSVNLVKFAFNNAKPGDIFVQKSPASTIKTLAEALLKIFDAKNDIKIIGTRHGEKLYETLLTREEIQKAEDLGNYYRVPADNRNLNYEQFFTKGDPTTSAKEDYNSHNTIRLDVDDVIKMLLETDFIKQELGKNE